MWDLCQDFMDVKHGHILTTFLDQSASDKHDGVQIERVPYIEEFSGKSTNCWTLVHGSVFDETAKFSHMCSYVQSKISILFFVAQRCCFCDSRSRSLRKERFPVDSSTIPLLTSQAQEQHSISP
mmetsp:Transcript_8955/g.33045  ORF Transcript_8955/g.33045 Transcript_8955/m.33045 type:complete len:124 (-) Transcript_8955:968-1339(-)